MLFEKIFKAEKSNPTIQLPSTIFTIINWQKKNTIIVRMDFLFLIQFPIYLYICISFPFGKKRGGEQMQRAKCKQTCYADFLPIMTFPVIISSSLFRMQFIMKRIKTYEYADMHNYFSLLLQNCQFTLISWKLLKFDS